MLMLSYSTDVHISNNATVGSLEFAVEAVYGDLPEDEGNILWYENVHKFLY